MNRSLILSAISFTFAVVALVMTFLNRSNSKFNYIDNTELMKEFKMTKELDANFQSVTNKRKEILDSMKLEIKKIENKIKMGQKELLDEYKNSLLDYQSVFESYDKENQEVNAQFNERVIKQLNQYLKEYGDEKKIDFILGANGTGSMLYANDRNNITKDVIKYVNAKYSGKR